MPYEEDNSFSEKELTEFLKRLSYAYLFMLVIAIVFAYFISRYITKSLKSIGDKLDQTRLNRRNEKIILKDAGEEIFNLVAAYNGMIDELDESAVKLAKSEREQAWREMAKQVAHEIKNPLTPMRLTVQNFQRKFDPEDGNIHKKVDEYSKTLIQQIDTMSSIASAFSNFAKMPAQQNETLNVVNIVKLALDIFNEEVAADISDTFVEIDWMIEDEVQDGYDYIYDQIVSIGELVSSKILYHTCKKQGINAFWLDVRRRQRPMSDLRSGDRVSLRPCAPLQGLRCRPNLDTTKNRLNH